jgi:hypothetical protein
LHPSPAMKTMSSHTVSLIFFAVNTALRASDITLANSQGTETHAEDAVDTWECDLKKCGFKPYPPVHSELSDFISKAASMVQNGSSPICAIEVGTADGSGTTMKLFDVLHRRCQGPDGRKFVIYTYEPNYALADKAAERWAKQRNVIVIPEFFMSKEALHDYVIQAIEGPDGDEYPGTGFYEKAYSMIPDQIAQDSLGGFLHTKPACVADLVLIDSTRYAHPGIVATLLAHNLSRPDTVFLIENDFWAPPEGDERLLLELHWRLADVSSAAPAGEMWPWLIFTIAGPNLSAAELAA